MRKENQDGGVMLLGNGKARKGDSRTTVTSQLSTMQALANFFGEASALGKHVGVLHAV
jgi:predicted trehalose synthase